MNIKSLNGVQVVGKVDGYVESLLNDANANINTMAKQFGRNVKIAQKDSHVFVNFGATTSSFDYNKMEKGSDFQKNVIKNIIANQKVAQKD